MTRQVWPVLASLLLSLGLAACGGEDSPSGPVNGDAPQPSSTASVADATVEANATPTEFETLRDGLRDRLDAIGASIGDTPSDIREQILASCRELADFAEPDLVEPICQDIDEAIERGDPGKIDLVLGHLASLEPN